MLMLPHTDEMGRAVGKAVGMMLSLTHWHVSLRLPTHPLEAVESEVRLNLARHKMQLPLYTGQLAAMARGLPVHKNVKAQTAANEPPSGVDEAATLQEVQDGKQTVLAPFKVVPAAKLLPFAKKAATPSSSSSTTRATQNADAEKAEKAEKETQAKAAARAKRQREADLSRAMAEGISTKKMRKTRSSKATADTSLGGGEFSFMEDTQFSE